MESLSKAYQCVQIVVEKSIPVSYSKQAKKGGTFSIKQLSLSFPNASTSTWC